MAGDLPEGQQSKDLADALADALLDAPNRLLSDGHHRDHAPPGGYQGYAAGCVVCKGDVEAMVRAILPVVARVRADVAEDLVDLRTRVFHAESALVELVRLKDGPRDAAYERDKPLAWSRARAVLAQIPAAPAESVVGAPTPAPVLEHVARAILRSALAPRGLDATADLLAEWAKPENRVWALRAAEFAIDAYRALPEDEGTQPGTEKIHAPWSTQQVDALNRYQASGLMHPFTCRGEHPEGRPALIAQHDGWLCPDPRCGVSQDWAHAWMAEAADEGTRQEGLINGD